MTGVKRKACGSKELDRPLSRFPLRGKAWAGKVPPTPRHVARQQKALARPVRRLPPQEGAAAPLVHPPAGLPIYGGSGWLRPARHADFISARV